MSAISLPQRRPSAFNTYIVYLIIHCSDPERPLASKLDSPAGAAPWQHVFINPSPTPFSTVLQSLLTSRSTGARSRYYFLFTIPQPLHSNTPRHRRRKNSQAPTMECLPSNEAPCRRSRRTKTTRSRCCESRGDEANNTRDGAAFNPRSMKIRRSGSLLDSRLARRCLTRAAFDVARCRFQPRSNQAGKFKFACIAYAVSHLCL